MKAYIKTYGCTLNQADSEIIASVLTGNDVQLSENREDAEVIIVNTCTVKKATQQKILYELSNLQKSNKKVVVTGCMVGANQDLIEKYAPSASIITTGNIQNITEVVSYANSGKRTVMTQYNKTDRLMFFSPKDSVIAKIPLSDGCLSSCSFCETKFARGPLNSFSEDRILNAIEFSVRKGAKEIQLTAQDTGAYGIDRRSNITKLMKKIALIEGDFRVRVGMLNPEHLGRYFDEFIEALESEKFYKFVHLPVQSGSNKVLSEMRRFYSIEEFEEQVRELRKNIANITIETDIIVGFPTETENDFDLTLDFIKNVKPEVTNMSRFSTRPHASASKLEQLNYETINRRSIILSRVVRSIQHEINDRFIGNRQDVIITEANDRSLNGRNEFYKQVVVRKNDSERLDVGSKRNVLIYAASANVLYGKQ